VVVRITVADDLARNGSKTSRGDQLVLSVR
jgi:hypothetical protein